MKKTLILLSIACMLVLLGGCQEEEAPKENMSLEEKVGQVFFIRPEALETKTSEDITNSKGEGVLTVSNEMKENYAKYPCGGIVLFTKNLDDEAQIKKFTSEIHELNPKTKILTCIDEEGGRVARLANNNKLNLNKVENMETLATTGIEGTENFANYIGSYLKEYGFDIDFAPVADVNTNPSNIVIGKRAFGSKPNTVKDYVLAYLRGLKSNNIIGCIKHFPGHGDTTNDTHTGYTEIQKTWDELKECELITFKSGIENGVEMIMTAHIALPNVTGNKLPSTLSKEILTDKLRGELNYDGVIITDAMEMGAIHNDYSSSESAILAFEAGADILLMPYNYKEAYEGLLEAVKSGRISEERLDASVNRILKLKGIK